MKQSTSVGFRNDQICFFISDVLDDSGLDSQPLQAPVHFLLWGQPAQLGQSRGPNLTSHPHVHKGYDLEQVVIKQTAVP